MTKQFYFPDIQLLLCAYHRMSPLAPGDALSLLRPAADGLLSIYRVSEKLNAPGYDEPDLHEEVQEPPTLF